jgi:hypothetical protein
MGYHPETLAFNFPPYPKGGIGFKGRPKPLTFGRWLYSLSPWIGVDVWHIDPEHIVPGRRRDDSCGWFARDLTPPIQKAVDEIMAAHNEGLRRMIEGAIMRRAPHDARYPSLKRMPVGDGYALAIMVLGYIDRIATHDRTGRWRKTDAASAKVARLAYEITLNDVDTVLDVETVEQFVNSLAQHYRRAVRPWWEHPRWHVHHWKINFHLLRNLRRMVEPCATCRKPLGFGYCPTADSRGSHHSECIYKVAAVQT